MQCLFLCRLDGDVQKRLEKSCKYVAGLVAYVGVKCILVLIRIPVEFVVEKGYMYGVQNYTWHVLGTYGICSY
jgi:hypothetical protein